MAKTLDDQIKQLKQTISEMEAQRAILGDSAVDVSLVPFRQKLAELEAQVATIAESQELPKQQRKLVTLLFMDVVGSTSKIASHLDPEDTLEIMDGALKRLAAPVEEHGGHVTRFMGDGFKAVFGAPVAREGDPEQAVRAGLDILEISQTIASELKEQWDIKGFQVRLGVNTGLVALGGMTEAEDTVMGVPVNLAARLESAAPPGGLLISHNTYRQVRGIFNVESLDSIEAKGFSEPVPIYRILGAKPRAFRVHTLGVEGVETRMVGRVSEITYLQDALYTAIEESEGQVVTICGEAGVGKSRLLYEFQNWIELLPEEVLFFQGRGRQEAQGMPYSTLRDLFTFRFQIQDDDHAEAAREKIESGFSAVFGRDQDGQMRAHILGQLLGFDFSASPHLKGVLDDAEQLRNRSLLYLGEYFQMISSETPTVIILEDVHWADDSSLDAVNRLGHLTAQLRILIVCAARHALFERRPYWGEGQTYHTRLELRPLSKRESRQLIAEILRLVDQIPVELRELVVRGAEGNPFYVEELIKMLIEDGVVLTAEDAWYIEPERLAEIEVPATLAGVLQARLDSLPLEERNVLQQASVVGRMFWDRLVAHIHSTEAGDGDPEIITQVLISLRDRELVYRREESSFIDTCEYIFKHEVLREVTYESVLKRLRRVYHGMVANWLIANSGERISEHSGLIADHLLLAGRNDQALEFSIQAGDTALNSYANSEAARYYSQALELSPTIEQRAELLSGLGETLSRQGQSEEALNIFRQGIDLYQSLKDSDGMARLHTRSSQVLFRIDNEKGWNLCQEGLVLLAEAPDSLGLARLLVEAGRIAYFIGLRDEVAPLCHRAMRMAERVGSLEVQADARITLIMLSEDFENSASILKEVVEITEANGLLGTAARAHNNLGFCVGTLGELTSAYQHFMRAAEIARWMGDSQSLCFYLQNAHEVACSIGQLKDAEEIISEIEQVQSITPGTWEKYNLMAMRGINLYARGEWMPALEETRALLDRAKQSGDLQGQSNFASNLALIIFELNRFQGYSAWEELEEGLKESIDIGLEITKSNHPRYRLAIVRARQGNYPEAHSLYEEEKFSYTGSEDYMDKLIRLWTEYELASSIMRWQEAVTACESLVDMCERSQHRWDRARKLIDLGDALINRNEPGDLERARKTYQKSLDMFTEMGAPGYVKVLEERLG